MLSLVVAVVAVVVAGVATVGRESREGVFSPNILGFIRLCAPSSSVSL